MGTTDTRTRKTTRALPWVFTAPTLSVSGVRTGTSLSDGVQTTTSYRTGRRSRSVDDAPLPGNRDELQTMLIKEYKESQRPLDTGHPFLTVKEEQYLSHPQVTRGSLTPYQDGYRGPLIPGWSTLPLPEAYPSLPGWDSGKYGSIAIARTSPTDPVANLAVTLAELKREGIPDLPGLQTFQRRASSARTAGSEYLNLEFGWKPLLSEVEASARAVKNHAKILRQLRRDDGKLVRRGYRFPVEREIETKRWTGPLTNVPNNTRFHLHFPNHQVPHTQTIERTRSVWFKGAYTYHLPDSSTLLGRIKMYEAYANKLLGVRITPEVLWELAPWSWFGDWNVTLGTSISNVSKLGSDGLVIVYGYLMCMDICTKTVTAHAYPGVGDISITCRVTRKQRIRANPYGFGSSPSSYTARQWSILGALGLTKSPRTLR